MDPLWPSLAAELKKELPAQQFDTWIKPLRGERHGEELVLLAPNHHVLRWVRSNLLNKIESRIERVAAVIGDPTRVLAGTDCGFDTSVGWGRVAGDVVWAKLRTLRDGARIASAHLFPPSRS